MHGGTVPTTVARGEQRVAFANIRLELDHMGGQLDVDTTEGMLTMVREAAFNVTFLRSCVERLTPGFESGPGASDGIVGRVDLESFKSAPHILVKMYDDERDRFMRYAKMCRDAGIEERKIQMQEEAGQWLTRTLDLIIQQLDLSEPQLVRLPQIMRDVVRQLEQGGDA
jgi:hypothetical protein